MSVGVEVLFVGHRVCVGVFVKYAFVWRCACVCLHSWTGRQVHLPTPWALCQFTLWSLLRTLLLHGGRGSSLGSIIASKPHVPGTMGAPSHVQEIQPTGSWSLYPALLSGGSWGPGAATESPCLFFPPSLQP